MSSNISFDKKGKLESKGGQGTEREEGREGEGARARAGERERERREQSSHNLMKCVLTQPNKSSAR